MPIQSRYVFVASMDVDPDKEDIFNEVYDTEHVPNLLKVPGVRAVTRLKGEAFRAEHRRRRETDRARRPALQRYLRHRQSGGPGQPANGPRRSRKAAGRPTCAPTPAIAGTRSIGCASRRLMPGVSPYSGRSRRSFAQYSSRFLISRSKPRSGGS